MEIKSYRDLKVWQKAMDLVTVIYEETKKLPKQETYGLMDQMRRAAVSIPSNIAEGHSLDSTPQYLRHVAIARGSVAELETQLLLCVRLHYLNKENLESAFKICDEVGKMLNSLQKSLKTRSLIPKSQSLTPSSNPNPQSLTPNPQKEI